MIFEMSPNSEEGNVGEGSYCTCNLCVTCKFALEVTGFIKKNKKQKNRQTDLDTNCSGSG